MTMPKFRTPYNYDTDVASHLTGLDCSDDPSRAQQHMKDECDINTLVKTYARTGMIPGQDLPAMVFELDEIVDYQTAMNAVLESQRAFGKLPSNVREYFHNDPAHLLSFLNDENNRAEAERLGLTIQKAVDKPQPEPVPADKPPVNEG